MTTEEAVTIVKEQCETMLMFLSRATGKNWLANNCFKEFFEAVWVLAKKQIPQKAVPNLWDEWFECPSCGGIVSSEDETLYAYCPDCGQKITLEEDNED